MFSNEPKSALQSQYKNISKRYFSKIKNDLHFKNVCIPVKKAPYYAGDHFFFSTKKVLQDDGSWILHAQKKKKYDSQSLQKNSNRLSKMLSKTYSSFP